MARASLAVVAALLAVVAGRQVCLPDRFQWKASGSYEIYKTPGGGYDLVEEFYDHPAKNYRGKSMVAYDGERYFQDLLILGHRRQIFNVTGKEHGGSIKCMTRNATAPNPNHCLLHDAKLSASGLVAGDVYTEVFGEHQGGVYAEIGLSNNGAVEVPIFSRQYIAVDKATTQTLYYDFSTSLPADAFQIPPICNAQNTIEGPPMDQDEVDAIYNKYF